MLGFVGKKGGKTAGVGERGWDDGQKEGGCMDCKAKFKYVRGGLYHRNVCTKNESVHGLRFL